VHESSAIPIYGGFCLVPGSGIIGGSLERRELEGKQAGEWRFGLARRQGSRSDRHTLEYQRLRCLTGEKLIA